MTADDLQTLTQFTTGPGLLGDGYLAHRGWSRGGFRGNIDYQQLLADALGITVEELQAAYEAAREAAIAQAVEVVRVACKAGPKCRAPVLPPGTSAPSFFAVLPIAPLVL